MHLPCAPASVSIARRALASELRAAGVDDAAVADAALVVSELLSNAILHAYPLPGERLLVAWSVRGESVEVSVSDGGSATVPHAGEPSDFAISGRGLGIVEHLSREWGVRADDVGLTVWALLRAPRNNGSAGGNRDGGGPGPSGGPDPDGPDDRPDPDVAMPEPVPLGAAGVASGG